MLHHAEDLSYCPTWYALPITWTIYNREMIETISKYKYNHTILCLFLKCYVYTCTVH